MRYDLLHPKALHKALVEHLGEEAGVPKERQVRRWVSGDTPVPGWARRVIDEIVGAPDTEKSAPAWAEALARESEGRIIAAIENADLLAVAQQVREDLEALRQQPAEASDDRSDAPGRGSSGQLGRVRE